MWLITSLRPQLLLLLLVGLVPVAKGFFWACNVYEIEMVPDKSKIDATVAALFPARLLMRKTSNTEERRYSCLTIEVAGGGRQDAMNKSLKLEEASDAQSPAMRADLTFTATIKYYELQTQKTVTVPHVRVSRDDNHGMTFESLPVTMFQSDTSTKRASLTLIVLTDRYGIYDTCVTGWLAFSQSRSSYMFVNKAFDAADTDYACLKEALRDETGNYPYHPVGICP